MTFVLSAGVLVWMYLAHRERRRALIAEAMCQAANDHAEALGNLLTSVTIIGAMVRGQRPIVTKAPDGMTLEEAQAAVNDVYDALAPKRQTN